MPSDTMHSVVASARCQRATACASTAAASRARPPPRPTQRHPPPRPAQAPALSPGPHAALPSGTGPPICLLRLPAAHAVTTRRDADVLPPRAPPPPSPHALRRRRRRRRLARHRVRRRAVRPRQVSPRGQLQCGHGRPRHALRGKSHRLSGLPTTRPPCTVTQADARGLRPYGPAGSERPRPEGAAQRLGLAGCHVSLPPAAPAPASCPRRGGARAPRGH
jgi:hypothetical protein